MTDDLIPEALAAASESISGWLVVGGFDDDPAEIAKAAVRAYLEEARRIATAQRRQRILAGIARARKHGTRSGKPIGRPPLDKSKVAAIARDIASGDTLAAIAIRYRIGEATVRRIRDSALCPRP